MKPILLAVLVLGSTFAQGQTAPAGQAPTLRSILLAQLKTTHHDQDWFVPAIKAVDGLTVQQAVWTPGAGDHSVAQLVNHLTFWNTRQLAKFRGETPSAFSGNNQETFTAPADQRGWDAAVRQLDEVMTAWEKSVESADDAKLQSWYSTIAHISTHNAYHTGQILYIRKQQGSWDSAKGVK
jgi:uncharacterized damage-inducible protein DinB